MKYVALFFACASLVFLGACHTVNPQKRAVAASANFRLQQADALRIPYQVQSLKPVVIKFGSLTAEQFNSLRKAYGGLSKVPYTKGRSYDLIDFLPPVMQALIDLGEPQPHEVSPDWLKQLPTRVDSIFVDQNCWGTSYAVSRHIQNPNLGQYSVFVNSQAQLFKMLKDRVRTRAETAIRFGDWLFISNIFPDSDSKFLGHTALVIDKNLFFEKEGPGQGNRWQLITGNDLHERWADHEDLPVVFEYSQVTGELEDPQSISLEHNRNEYDLNIANYVPAEERKSLIFSIDSSNPMMGRPWPALHPIVHLNLKIDAKTQRGSFK